MLARDVCRRSLLCLHQSESRTFVEFKQPTRSETNINQPHYLWSNRLDINSNIVVDRINEMRVLHHINARHIIGLYQNLILYKPPQFHEIYLDGSIEHLKSDHLAFHVFSKYLQHGNLSFACETMQFLSSRSYLYAIWIFTVVVAVLC